MKSQNQISLNILTLALLLIASCEVWALNFGQSQSNPLLIQTQPVDDSFNNFNIIDFNYHFKPISDNGGPRTDGRTCYNENLTGYYLSKNIKEDLKRLKSIIKDDTLPTLPLGTLCSLGAYNYSSIADSNRTAKVCYTLVNNIDTQIQTNGTGGGSWSSPSTWLNGKVPDVPVFIIVSNGDILTIDSNVTINTLYLDKNSKVKSNKKSRIIEITKDIIVSDSASIISNFGSGKLDCYITAANDGKSLISIAETAKVSFENLKILGETFFENGNMDVMNFSAIKQKDFIAKTGTVLNIGQKK